MYKQKIIGVVVALGLLSGGASVALAETVGNANAADVTALQKQIAELQQMIKTLSTQVSEAKKANMELKTEIAELRLELKLGKPLKVGDEGDDVKLLQEVLATDPTIYPEGKKTGYYGALTASAVKRFQEKIGLEKVGNVGPKTLEKLNTILKDNASGERTVPMGLLKDSGRIIMVPLHEGSGETMALVGKAMIGTKDATHTKVVIEMVNHMRKTKCLSPVVSAASSGTSTDPVCLGMANSSMMPIMASTTQPAHIHLGSCTATGAVKYPLNAVVNGRSETVLDVGIDELIKASPLYVNVHKSPEELAVTVGCGNIHAPAVVWKERDMDGDGDIDATDKLLLEKLHANSMGGSAAIGVKPMMPIVKPVEQPSATSGAVREIKVLGANFKFDPAEITVKKGEKVRLTLKGGDMLHDWVVDELGLATAKIKAGEVTSIEFTPTKVGTFEYYCSVGSHRAMGMVGNLIVTE